MIMASQQIISKQKAIKADLDDDVEGDKDCAVCLQPCLQPIKLSCNHTFCFLCIKGVTMNHSQMRCPMCRGSITQEDLENPNLVCLGKNSLKRDLVEVEEQKYKWFYSGATSGWWEYDERTTKDINDAFEIFTTASEKQDSKKPKKKRRKQKPTKDNQQNDDKSYPQTGSCEMMIAGALYVIDFINMAQYRKCNPKKKRQIKRESKGNEVVDCKGIAGLRKIENTPTEDNVKKNNRPNGKEQRR